jgi:hypothetical protein
MLLAGNAALQHRNRHLEKQIVGNTAKDGMEFTLQL